MTVQHATRTEDEDVMHTLYIHTVLYTRIHTPPAERFTIATWMISSQLHTCMSFPTGKNMPTTLGYALGMFQQVLGSNPTKMC